MQVPCITPKSSFTQPCLSSSPSLPLFPPKTTSPGDDKRLAQISVMHTRTDTDVLHTPESRSAPVKLHRTLRPSARRKTHGRNPSPPSQHPSPRGPPGHISRCKLVSRLRAEPWRRPICPSLMMAVEARLNLHWVGGWRGWVCPEPVK